MELFLECQGMAIECRTGSKPALYRCCEALLFVADWRFWCLAAALFLHLWLLLPYSPVFLSVVMPPVFFFFPSRDLLFFVTAYYSASPSTLPHPHPLLMSWLHHVSSSYLVVGCSFPEFLTFLTFGDDDTCSEIPQYSAILLSVSIFSYLYNWNWSLVWREGRWNNSEVQSL